MRHQLRAPPPLLELGSERELRARPLKVHVVGVLRCRLWLRVPLPAKAEHPVAAQQLDIEEVAQRFEPHESDPLPLVGPHVVPEAKEHRELAKEPREDAGAVPQRVEPNRL